jgi:hypothetical protein
MVHHLCPARFALMALAALAGLSPAALEAATPPAYQIQTLVRSGDQVGDLEIQPTSGGLRIGTLNDQGQLVFVTQNTAGGEMLLQYSAGTLTSIGVAEQDGPLGKWPASIGFRTPVRMNQSGSIVFNVSTSETDSLGTFLWDAATKEVTPVAVAGMPAGTDWTFSPARDGAPAINKSGDIVFGVGLKEADSSVRQGVFFRERTGQLQAVALPGESLGLGEVVEAFAGGINDAGMVAFRAATVPNGPTSVYLWENGTVTPVAFVRGEVPGAEKVADLPGVWLNNQNHTLLLRIRIEDHNSDSLWRWEDRQLTPLLVPGQEMPGGGLLDQLQPEVSDANEAGQHAFIATVTDAGTTRAAIYRLDSDGTLSLVLQTGASTPLGLITHLGAAGAAPVLSGIGLNGQGQLALPVRIDNGPPMIVLLTPLSP